MVMTLLTFASSVSVAADSALPMMAIVQRPSVVLGPGGWIEVDDRS